MRTHALAVALALAATANASGATWTTQLTPNPAGGTNNTLRGVACPVRESCVAVGQYTSGSSIVTLGEHWAGGRWTLDSTPTPGSGVDTLQAIACTSSSACTAVGSGGTSRLEVPVERWNGSTWALQTTPERATTNLEGVDCYAAEGCIAVAGTAGGALSELWNGAEWRTLAVPNPPLPLEGEAGEVEARAQRFASVDCTSSTFCLAVGRYVVRYREPEPSVEYPNTETWNGREWAVRTTPLVSEHVLNDVSCTSATFCMAVGRSSEAPLAMSWNGTEWTVREPPRFETTTTLESVSCTSSTACTAVGWSQGPFRARAVQWDGTRWTSQTVPNPGRGGILNEVACTSSTLCTAVGHYTETSGTLLTLALRYE